MDKKIQFYRRLKNDAKVEYNGPFSTLNFRLDVDENYLDAFLGVTEFWNCYDSVGYKGYLCDGYFPYMDVEVTVYDGQFKDERIYTKEDVSKSRIIFYEPIFDKK